MSSSKTYLNYFCGAKAALLYSPVEVCRFVVVLYTCFSVFILLLLNFAYIFLSFSSQLQVNFDYVVVCVCSFYGISLPGLRAGAFSAITGPVVIY